MFAANDLDAAGETLTFPNSRMVDVALKAGRTLALTLAAGSAARLIRKGDSTGNPDQGYQDVTSSAVFGPFPKHRRYTLECRAGSVLYTMANAGNNAIATQLGNMEGFTGNRTLVPDDNGKVLRCDDPSNVTITVPGTLPSGFNVGFAMWGAGTVTVAAGSGATKRSSTSALSTQYSLGSVLVGKNNDLASAEFVLGGGFA